MTGPTLRRAHESPGSADADGTAVVPGKLAGRFHNFSWESAAGILAAVGLAWAVRYVLLDFKSLDFYASLKPWYNTIKDQGFAAFGTDFSTYNPPYLYLLYMIARFGPDLPTVVAVKIPALASDFACAYVMFKIVRVRFDRSAIVPTLAAIAVLFTPTVILNSAFWGQADSVYTLGILACVYFLMRSRSMAAMLAFGFALAFKLQAIFLAPVLLALVLKRSIAWKSILAIPLVLILALLPSWIAGRPLPELLNVYLYQASQFQSLTMNAASAYSWIPQTNEAFNLLYGPGVILGMAVAFTWFALVFRSPRALTAPQIVEVSLLACLLIPFFLPKMHERYFYPADLLAIAFAFYYPRLFYVPIFTIGASFASYQPFLFGTELVPLPILSLILLAMIGIVFRHCATQLYASHTPDEAPNAEPTADYR